MCILQSKQTVTRAGKTTPRMGNHTMHECSVRQRRVCWCARVSHKHTPCVTNNPAAGKRDRPNECSIKQKDRRPRWHPVLSYPISFPRFSFYFVSRGNSMFLTGRGKKTEPAVLKNNVIRGMAVLSVASKSCLSQLHISDTQHTCG